jgi:ATP-dependent DNA helicase RecG
MSTLSLEDLQALRETVEIEFKRAAGPDGRGELPKDFWPTYSAMANTDGGEIFLGVEEVLANRLRTVSISSWERVRQQIFELASNPQKVSVCLLRDSDVENVIVGNDVVLKVRVPRASRQQRPVYVGENPLKGSYVRRNEGDFHLDEDAVKRMLSEQTEQSRDSRLLPHFTIADLDPSTVEAYRSMFAARDPSHPFLREALPEFLRQLNVWRKDRETAVEGLTLAGLLMFGRLNAIYEAVPHYVLDYQERDAARAERRWIDRLTTDGSWSGNLFDFYTRVFSKLTADLKVPFRNDDGVRKQLTPVHEALQEALVNALIHADYGGRVPILIVKRPDMFGFRNPGLMRVPLESAKRGGVSDCRNRFLQKMFQLAGAGDQAGSGVPRILGVWKTQSWREPLVYEKRDPDQTLFELQMASLLPEHEVVRLEKKYGDRFRQLVHNDKVVVVAAAMDGVTSHTRVCGLTNQHPADVTKQLGRLSREGFLQPDGRGRGTVYRSADMEPATLAAALGFEDMSGPRAEAANLPVLAGNPPTSGGRAPQLSPKNGELLRQKYPQGIPGRLNDTAMRELILLLLGSDYLSVRDLALALNRNPEFIRSKYVKPLLAQSAIVARFPENPSHPEQAYKLAPDREDPLRPGPSS